MKIMRKSDRVKLKIDDVTLTLAPLTFQEKTDCMNMSTQAGESIEDRFKVVVAALKYSVKGIEGIENYDGTKYEAAFDESGNLSEETISDLLNSVISEKLVYASYQLVNGFQDKLVDPTTGKAIKGVKIEFPESKPIK